MQTVIPQAVIFDLDGCLVDSEPLVYEVIVSELQLAGMTTITSDDIRERFIGATLGDVAEYARAQGVGLCSQRFAANVQSGLITRYTQHLPRIEAMVALVKQLHANAVPVAIATGGSLVRMAHTLRCGGIDGYFENTACSAETVARGKPAPDVFLLAAQTLGVAAENCIVIEDSPLGIRGAVAAGMRAIGFTGGSHLEGVRDAHAVLLSDAGAEAVYADAEKLQDRVLQLLVPELRCDGTDPFAGCEAVVAHRSGAVATGQSAGC